jgi:hypothetical protein
MSSNFFSPGMINFIIIWQINTIIDAGDKKRELTAKV